MGVIRALSRRNNEEIGEVEEAQEAGLDTTAQIAIGVVVPLVVLLGGLILFIWRTERRRRAARAEDARKHPTNMRNPLTNVFRPSKGARIDSPKDMQFGSDELHKDRHELGDGGYIHELADTGRIDMQGPQKPLPSPPRRTDSLLPNDFNKLPYIAGEEPSQQPSRNSMAENLIAPNTNANRNFDFRQSYPPNDSQRLSTLDSRRHSQAAPPPTEQRTWRTSLQPTSFFSMHSFQSKRDMRVSKGASSHYSRTDFDGISPLSEDDLDIPSSISDNEKKNSSSLEEKRSEDLSSPPISAVDSASELSRENSTRLGEGDGGEKGRGLAMNWRKRLSEPDELDGAATKAESVHYQI